MKLLLDAHLSPEIAERLQKRGYDAQAVTLRDDLPNNTPDHQLMEIAEAESRVVVTNNVKDFRSIAAQRIVAGEGHSGLILVSPATPRTKASVKPLVAAIEKVIAANPEGLTNSERWI